MNFKENYNDYKEFLRQKGITKLYHFTDRDNLESIIKNGGLYSWKDCNEKCIAIAKPGGAEISRQLDERKGLGHYIRLSFTKRHPMMYIAMNDGRISNPIVLEIDPEVVYWEDTKYSDRNATRNEVLIGNSYECFDRIHWDSVLQKDHFNLDEQEMPFYQAEVMVKKHIPLHYILNIRRFSIPNAHNRIELQTKTAYTAQISRNNPTAFIFLVDHSISMQKMTSLFGETMTMAEAASRIVNRQINELVLRCIKSDEIRHYYDIAVIGYGESAYSGWQGQLSGRNFVSPKELYDNPYKKIVVREEKRTRKGIVLKEVEKVQWLEPRHDGHWTHYHNAFDKAKELLTEWMAEHQNKDCYPPTIIHITDGEYNHASKEEVLQKANNLKSMFTNDGNVLLFNIHIVSNKLNETIAFPVSKDELKNNIYGQTLFEMSSLLPLRYNEDIANSLNDNRNERHSAMAVNADMSTLIQLMDIGTPTNIKR